MFQNLKTQLVVVFKLLTPLLIADSFISHRYDTCVAVPGAGNDYQKDKQFKKLNAQKDKLEVKVIRDGEQTLVENTEIVVGDLLLLDTGDKIAADGVVMKGFNLVVDEAALTGESEPLNKGAEDVWCMSGSEVSAADLQMNEWMNAAKIHACISGQSSLIGCASLVKQRHLLLWSTAAMSLLLTKYLFLQNPCSCISCNLSKKTESSTALHGFCMICAQVEELITQKQPRLCKPHACLILKS